MIKPILKWDPKSGYGSVTFPFGFDEQHWVVKADSLNDWIVDLTDKYNSLMTKPEPCADDPKNEGQAVAIGALSLLEGYSYTDDKAFLSAAMEILREFDRKMVTGEAPKMSANLKDCLGRMIHGDAVGGVQ